MGQAHGRDGGVEARRRHKVVTAVAPLPARLLGEPLPEARVVRAPPVVDATLVKLAARLAAARAVHVDRHKEEVRFLRLEDAPRRQRQAGGHHGREVVASVVVLRTPERPLHTVTALPLCWCTACRVKVFVLPCWQCTATLPQGWA